MRLQTVMAVLGVGAGMAACTAAHQDFYSGYVESEPVYVASPVAGRLVNLHVNRGDRVQAGAALFELEQDRETAAVQESQARVAQAQAQAQDLSKGSRAEELAARRAAVAQAQAQLRQSASDLQRQSELARAGFISSSALVALQARKEADAARVAQLQAELREAELGARADTQQAALAGIEAARAALAQTRWQLQQTQLSAPVAASVQDTLYRVGEWVPAGAPVVQLLAPAAIKLRFYVPQSELARLTTGTKVQIRCDGCAAPIPATIKYIAQQAEYTPPVIYSRDQREHLVYMVEAWPDRPGSPELHPGLPVEVRLTATR